MADTSCSDARALSGAVLFPDVSVQLSGEDGNVFLIIGRVRKALRAAGETDAAISFHAAALQCPTYDDVLQLVMRTVNVH